MKHLKNTSRNVLHQCGPGFSTQQLRKEVCVTMRETSVVFVVSFFYVLLIPHSHADPGLPTLPSVKRDAATRTVNGSYRVDKMYSSRNNYHCIWVMANETRHEIRREMVAPELSTFNESGNEFVNGTCSFFWPLPIEQGKYTINLTVFPGENDTTYTAATFVIDKYTITGCSSDGYIDVREDIGTTITCDGIQGLNYNIYWALSGNRIGDCGSPGNCRLTDTKNTDYNLTRPSASKSELRIVGNFRSKAGKTIMCSLRSNDTRVSCMIDIVYPGRPTHPTLSTDGVTWTVSGSVRVEKMYSSRNQYSCMWTQENETHHEIKTERVAPKLSIFNESNREFYNGTCSFSWPLPTEEGNYTSYLIVLPGDGDKPYSAGTFIIEHPGDPDIHCDVRPVVEKSDVTCQCRASSTKAGSPAPSLSWPGFSNSSQLRLTNIRREDNGTQYTCQLTWGPNAKIVRTATYTLHFDTYEGGETSTEQAKSMAAFGGGVGAAVAVIAIIIIVALVVVYKRRQKTYARPKVRRNEDTHPYMDLSVSVTASTSDVSHPEYKETNITMGQSSTQEPGINTYEQPSPRRKEDAYLYTDLTPSVTSSAHDDAIRDYRGNSRGNSIEAGQGSTEEPGMNTYEQPSPRRNEDTYLYTDLTPSVTSSDHSGRDACS